MATIAVNKPICVTQNHNVISLPEAASQSFQAYEFVYLASGYITACASEATAIYGQVLEAGHNTTAGAYNVSVIPAEPDVEFEMNLNTTSAITHVGNTYGLVVASNAHQVNIADVTTDAFRIQRLSGKDTVGDTNGRVIVKVLSDVSQVGPGEKTA